MAIKVKDLASMLGVSPSTVSLVLNNRPGISEATRQRVFDKLTELGYSSMIPRSSAVNSLNLRLVIFKKHGGVVADTHFFSQVIEGIDSQTRKNGCNLLINYISGLEPQEERMRVFAQSSCDGVILLATEMDAADLEPFLKLNLPMVVLDSYFETIQQDAVVINNVQGASAAVRHLIAMGHRSIGYLHSRIHINNFQERREGVVKALSAAGLELPEQMIFRLEPSIEGAAASMRELLRQHRSLPTAFFAANDLIAIGAARALKEAGCRIPEDISIIGFDDMPVAEAMDPPLTTVYVPKQRLGMLAVDRLISQIGQEAPEFIKVEVGTHLVKRRSVRPL